MIIIITAINHSRLSTNLFGYLVVVGVPKFASFSVRPSYQMKKMIITIIVLLLLISLESFNEMMVEENFVPRLKKRHLKYELVIRAGIGIILIIFFRSTTFIPVMPDILLLSYLETPFSN